jgi:hypothetical protein
MENYIKIEGVINTSIEEGSWLSNFLEWLESRSETFCGLTVLDNEDDTEDLKND